MPTDRSPKFLTRRQVVALSAAVSLCLATLPHAAFADDVAANSLVKNFADQLVGIVNGPGAAAEKKAALGPVIGRNVDVDKIARFCLGRFWSSASPAQQAQYVTIFRQVLLNNISGHLGDYQGVSYSMSGDRPQGSNVLVGTVIRRPNSPDANVQWVVDTDSGTAKVIDVVAEGTSLRLTQRNDYASYLTHHGNDIGALLAALQQQLDSAG